ncbi:hypothetical protein PsYK624_112490 [Phanerochaete sordida]|uniref:Uncharacterized protein n=1 Tax=Phanerochaete sordida TaxID=48140 RepID=A0A9P3GK85_9APHY|nr:hypothetical protein PsYK624_112490 [Phanerochaete sordida]
MALLGGYANLTNASRKGDPSQPPFRQPPSAHKQDSAPKLLSSFTATAGHGMNTFPPTSSWPANKMAGCKGRAVLVARPAERSTTQTQLRRRRAGGEGRVCPAVETNVHVARATFLEIVTRGPRRLQFAAGSTLEAL